MAPVLELSGERLTLCNPWTLPNPTFGNMGVEPKQADYMKSWNRQVVWVLRPTLNFQQNVRRTEC